MIKDTESMTKVVDFDDAVGYLEERISYWHKHSPDLVVAVGGGVLDKYEINSLARFLATSLLHNAPE